MTNMNPDRERRLLAALAAGPTWQTSMELAGQVPRETSASVAALLLRLRTQGMASARLRARLTHEYAITPHGQARLAAVTGGAPSSLTPRRNPVRGAPFPP